MGGHRRGDRRLGPVIAAGLALAAVLPAGPPGELAGDATFEARISQSVAAAQRLQGSVDGQWLLFDAKGVRLYRPRLVDPPGGHDPLQGAWLDLRGDQARAAGPRRQCRAPGARAHRRGL